MPDFDLSLAPALEVLLRERSVTRAARLLGRSQPAISRELAALRIQLGDPLLVRTSSGLTLTPCGERLLAELPHALAQVRRVLEGSAFDPFVAKGTYRVSMSDYEAAVLLPRVLAVLDERAPRLRIAVVQRHRPAVEAALNSGDVSLAVGRFIRPMPTLHHRPLFSDEFVLIADRDHHDADCLQDQDYLLGLPFVLISPGNSGDLRGLVDDQLDTTKRSRFVRLSTPHFATLPGLIAGKRTVAFAPAKLLAALTLPKSVVWYTSPLPVDRFEVSLLWHERTQGDPASIWMRQLFSIAVEHVG